MDVLIDTCVWSEAMRRVTPNVVISAEMQKLIGQGRAKMIGLVRQELLTGIKHQNQYEILRGKLRSFPDLDVTTDTHELAAEFANKCISRGFQGSHSDFLICAVSKMENVCIYTLDNDFIGFSSVLGLNLYNP